MQKALLLDGTALCYRAFYGIRSLSTAEGRPTNAVYGFILMLQALLQRDKPDYLAAAFDVGQPTFRHKKFEEYKAQRKPMPEPLVSQIPVVKKLLAAYRIPVYEAPGYEAEDVLATITAKLKSPEIDIWLVTGDKDALQLVNGQVKVYNPHGKEPALLDSSAVHARYGIGPEQIVDLLALMGDSSDNIPGVPGVGEKTAVQLLQRFGSIDGLYAQLAEIDSPARRQQLEESREQVELARELARIRPEAPIAFEPEDIRLREPDWAALRALYRELEFRKLFRDLEDKGADPMDPGIRVTWLRDTAAAGAWFGRLSASAATAAAAWPIDEEPGAAILATAGPDGEVGLLILDPSSEENQAATQRAVDWLGDPRSPKIAHDGKALARLLQKRGIGFAGLSSDTMLAAYLLNPARSHQNPSEVIDEWLNRSVPTLDSVAHRHVLDAEPARQAMAALTASLLPLHAALSARLADRGLTALYHDLELPLTLVLARMESIGVAVDLDYLAALRADMQAKISALLQEVIRLAGCDFNPNSPKQLANVLFERLKLPVGRRTKTGPSTDSDVLRQLASRHPLPQKLIEYRELTKLTSTYVEALPKMVDPKTGRIHTCFNQTAAATGRLSSSDPNLQNIPIKTELGRSIRKAFVAQEPRGVLIAADYSQIELRILAHVSKDEQLTKAFLENRDIHRYTASLIYGIPEAEVQPEQRSAMKAINFGVLYGMSAHGLSKELGVGYEEAQAFIDAYFQRYPRVRGYLDAQIAHAKKEGFVQTMLGRRRYIPEINSADPVVRQMGERMAINAPIQGTAADLIKRAMVEIAPVLDEAGLGRSMVLQVHDELVFECDGARCESLIPLVRRVMESAIELSVPLAVTVKTGPNWLEMSEWKGRA